MRHWILSVAAVGGLGGVAAGDVINVPGDFATIQAAVDAAQDDDEIIVAPGIYPEDVEVQNKVVAIRSSGGPDVTTIDAVGGQWGIMFCIDNTGQEGNVLEGFTITGATGAGVRLDGALNTRIADCTVTANEGPNEGAGIFMADGGSSMTVERCIFANNTSFQEGGAVSVQGTATFVGCLFISNSADERGRAVKLNVNAVSVSFVHCSFVENTSMFGGAVWNPRSPLFVDCLFVRNSASHAGGAIMNGSQDSVPIITGCTFVANETVIGGGALFNTNFSLPIIANSILWANVPDQVFDDISLTTILFSDVEGGWPGIRNINADPLFVNPLGDDYRLQPESPAIDAAHNWGVGIDVADLDDDGDTSELTPVDLDGNPRFADGPVEDTGCGVPVVVDMGAYEFQGDPFPVKFGDLDGDGAVGVLDFLALLAEWGTCPEGCCLADLDLDGEVGVTDFLTLLGNWG